MENKEIWPCMFAGDCDCKVLDDGTIAISYRTWGVEKSMLYEVIAFLGQVKTVTFRQIHYICTNEQPGPVTSTWPLVWNGLVQIDDDKLTFEFVERKDPNDKV